MLQYLRNSNNVLLMKDGLGKSRPAPYTLPDSNFAFGKGVGGDTEGAKEGKICLQA